MARSALEKLKCRLSLVDYFRHVFGVKDVNDPGSVRQYYDTLAGRKEGYQSDGRSYVSKVLEGIVRGIDIADLLRYDDNVKRHTDKLNQRRNEPIRLKYFQILAALMTEYYLDRITKDEDSFLNDLNSFVEDQNNTRTSRIKLPSFGGDDLNKIAYWMATGSGKTLLMHINYYQYLYYQPEISENVLLVTPNEGLSIQHINEMQLSGIPCQRFNADTADLFSGNPETVKVIEITKLVEDKKGGGQSIDITHLEGRNLIFVDEGHKGASSEAQAWRNRRAAIAENGFTFEYSATFGQGIGGAGVDIEEEYGKAIIFDYSYPRFYDDGYGKDYRILNIEQSIDPDLTDRYLLANLLSFYEQIACYKNNRHTYYDEYNIEPPLLTYVGHTVTAGKTWSNLGKNDKRSLSDVQNQVIFLYRVLQNEKNWVPKAIDGILDGDAGLDDEEGNDLFRNSFNYLRSSDAIGDEIYSDILRSIFHVPSSAGLHLVNLQSADGEIGLRAALSDQYFGLINIGDAANFLKMAEEKTPEIIIDSPDQFSGSLFHNINQQGSTINILLGAKKFIEGWDSWRVSTMGLMNIGVGEGPQIIQLFGRGVRLLGKNRSLKRSDSLGGDHPEYISTLETLNIFGVRARYMVKFREYLADEGIDTEPREIIKIDTKVNEEFIEKGLITIRPVRVAEFSEEKRLLLEYLGSCKPTIDLDVQAEVMYSNGLIHEQPGAIDTRETRVVDPKYLNLLDWKRVYSRIWDYCQQKDYENLILNRNTLQYVLYEGKYTLYCPEDILEPNSFSDLIKIERIVLMILRKYIDNFYNYHHKIWEQKQLEYQILDENDKNVIQSYTARVKQSAKDFYDLLKEMRDDQEFFVEEDDRIPRVYFDRHLYLPLFLEDQGEDPVVKYKPRGLNPGEKQFITSLRSYLETEDGQDILERNNCELFLLRNQSRGRGVGFVVDGDRIFPDFIIWLRKEHRQEILFIDPHGLVIGSNLETNPKVQFFKTIKEYEEDLNKKSGRKNVSLFSYIISQTPYDELSERTGIDSADEFFQDYHVLFPERENFAELILKDVLRSKF